MKSTGCLREVWRCKAHKMIFLRRPTSTWIAMKLSLKSGLHGKRDSLHEKIKARASLDPTALQHRGLKRLITKCWATNSVERLVLTKICVIQEYNWSYKAKCLWLTFFVWSESIDTTSIPKLQLVFGILAPIWNSCSNLESLQNVNLDFLLQFGSLYNILLVGFSILK
jgi:hypothetical protein